jgi:hypothetical protein
VTEKYGTYLIRTGWAVGLDIAAFDERGQPLTMLRSTKDKLQENLQVILSGSPPEAFFLIPETQLVYRLHQLENKYNAPIFAQVYRSASGQLLAEVPIKNGEDLIVEATRLTITYHQIPRYRVVYNPGAPIESAGMVLLFIYAFMQAKNASNGQVSEQTLEHKTPAPNDSK